MSGRRSWVRESLLRVWTSTVGWSFAVVALRAGGFLLVLPLALRFLRPEELGLWYLFVATSDLCSAIEMGLSGIIGRAVSFFLGGLQSFPKGGLKDLPAPSESPTPNLAGLAGLRAFSGRIYTWIALGVLGGMTLGGLLLVGPKLGTLGDSPEKYVVAYGVYAVAVAAAVFGLYWPAFLSGLSHVRLSQRTLLVALVCNYATSALGLLLGLGLLSLALGQLAMATVTFFMARHYAYKVCPGLKEAGVQTVRLSDLWPSTWRSMLVFMSHYFCSQGTVLVCGVVLDLAATASYGLTMRLAVLAHGVAGIWLTARTPGISVARAAGDLATARQLVAGALPRCLAMMVLGCLALYTLGPLAIRLIGSRTDLLPSVYFAGMLAMLCLDFVVGFHSTVLQTANRFPQLPVMVGSAAGTMALAFFLGRQWGVPGMLAAPVLVQALCAYWWMPLRCWRELRS